MVVKIKPPRLFRSSLSIAMYNWKEEASNPPSYKRSANRLRYMNYCVVEISS